jgi:uncharacterized protein YhhL (DUF1145 family)
MQTPVPAAITLRLRARYALAGLIMLALWAASLVSLFRDTGTLNVVLAVIATFTIFPLGLVALLGGVHGSEASMRRAHIALFAAGGLLAVAVIAEMLRRTVFAGS